MSAGLPRILVIDDEAQIRKMLRIGLAANGYEVIDAETGAEGARLATSRSPDAVILDLGLPDLDGVEVLRRIRTSTQVPVIVLSVRARDNDKIGALDAGADDYVTKPFSIAELLARIRVALRRQTGGEEPPKIFEQGGLKVDLVERRLTLDGRAIALTRKEFAILSLLVAHPGRVIVHGHLLREVWGPNHEGDTQYLRVYIRQLREKLGDDPANPRYIENEPGVGYRWMVGS